MPGARPDIRPHNGPNIGPDFGVAASASAWRVALPRRFTVRVRARWRAGVSRSPRQPPGQPPGPAMDQGSGSAVGQGTGQATGQATGQVMSQAGGVVIDARVQAAVAGDRAAAEALLAELLPRVRNLVRYLIRGDHEVDDIAQEALIALARGLAGYRGDGAFTAWADRIVARVTFAHLRKVRRDQAQRAEVPDLAAVPHPDGPPDPYATRRQMVKLLDQIPTDQRHALVLHHVLEMSVPEIADQLEISPETVRSRLRLGKARMRALLPGAGSVGEEREV